MKRLGLLAATALASTTLLPAAHAQTAAPPLTYAQPLAPQAVKEVQHRLRQLGAYNGAVDGVWGNNSAVALQRFQQSHGLQVTGQLNQATVATLGIKPDELVSSAAETGVSSQAFAQPLEPGVVRSIQQRLGALGFYHGGIDGIWGDRSIAAVEHFQQSRGLRVTGELNPSTVTAMGFNPNDLMAQARAPLSGSSVR